MAVTAAGVERLLGESVLSARAAAALIPSARGRGTDGWSVVRWIQAGELEGFFSSGWFTSREAVARFLAARTAAAMGVPSPGPGGGPGLTDRQRQEDGAARARIGARRRKG